MKSNGSTGRGAMLLTGAMFGASLGNYGVNLALGRWLAPAEFANVALFVAILLVLTAFSIGIQLVTSKVVTGSASNTRRKVGVVARGSLIGGLVVGGFLAAASPILASYFRTGSALPFVVLGIAMPFYALQSVGRGTLQGRSKFGPLAASFVVEAIVRAVVTTGALAAGLGATGAILGFGASFVCVCVVVRTSIPLRALPLGGSRRSFLSSLARVARPVSVLLLTQVVINNEDVLFAKRALSQVDAGRYGSIALVGRGVFFISWAVATAMFPAVSERSNTGDGTARLLTNSILAVVGIGSAAVVGSLTLGDLALTSIFGSSYANLGSSLALYALAATMFAIANLLATYHLALGNGVPSLLLLLGAGLQTLLLASHHSTIHEIVQMQAIVMVSVLAGVFAQHLTPSSKRSFSPEIALP
jgi:O-antigen/teichoic acid export membrane protein